jgi:4-amino-4-deoxy-L-arabinose transferase-like glycosyltransferase
MMNNNKGSIYPLLLLKDRPLIIVLILSLLVRLVIMWIYPDQHFPDAVAYKNIGKEIFSGEFITNNIYMPLYPIWSYMTGGGKVQVLMDILISVISVWLVFLLSFRLFNNRFAALLSATIAAFYPHFLFYSVSGLTEIFYTFLLLLSFLLFYDKKIILASFISVLALLVRPTFDFLNPVLIVLFVGFVHALGWRLVLKYVGIYFIIYLVIMSPWWMHQYQKYGEFVRLNLADGIVLYSGNNPLNKTGGGIVGSDVDMSSFNNEINPIIRNNKMKNEAIEFIVDNPRNFIDLAGLKFLRFWRLWPHTNQYNQWYIITASLLSYGLVLFLAVGFLFRNAKKYLREVIPIFASIAYLTIVHMVTISSIRYRFPLEPFLIIFAGYFAADILKEYRWINWIKNKI